MSVLFTKFIRRDWLVLLQVCWVVGLFFLVGCFVGWLVCLRFDWFVGWVVVLADGWLVGWLVGWSVGWSVSWLVGWSVGRSVGRSVALLLLNVLIR